MQSITKKKKKGCSGKDLQKRKVLSFINPSSRLTRVPQPSATLAIPRASAQNQSNVNVWRLSSRANVRINSRGEPQPTSRRHFTAQKSRQAECVVQVMHAAASLLLLVVVVVVLRRSFHEKRCRNIIKTDTKWCNFFNVPTAEF